MPRVSVILTTYNRPQLLQKAVESVLSQTFQDWELILLDDNSSDQDQLNYLAKLFNTRDERISIIRAKTTPEERKATVRYATLINHGLKIARGEFITYLCDDDYFLPNRLQDMVDYLDERQDVSFIAGDQLIMELYPDGRFEPTMYRKRQLNSVIFEPCEVVDHSSVMHRASCLQKVAQWPTDISLWGRADGKFFNALVQAGFPLYPLKKETDVHVYHDGSWTRGHNWIKLGTQEEQDVPQR